MKYLNTKNLYIPPAPAKIAYFPSKPFDVDKYKVLRSCAKDLGPKVQLRLEWIIFYETIGNKDVTYTANHFSISRKTFYKWHNRFKKSRSGVQSLQDRSRAPKTKRKWEVTYEQEDRIIHLRNKTRRIYGKAKLKKLYFEEYGEEISTWKIERVIRKHNLYKDKAKHEKIQKKRARAKKNPRKRIQSINQKEIDTFGFLWHIDCIILNWYGTRRVVVTAVEHITRLAYARIYPSHASKNTKDFLNRLTYLVEGKVYFMHSDNGSEFEKHFRKQCEVLGIKQIFSRPHTPKDNPMVERFNRTLEEEWLDITDVDLSDIQN